MQHREMPHRGYASIATGTNFVAVTFIDINRSLSALTHQASADRTFHNGPHVVGHHREVLRRDFLG